MQNLKFVYDEIMFVSSMKTTYQTLYGSSPHEFLEIQLAILELQIFVVFLGRKLSFIHGSKAIAQCDNVFDGCYSVGYIPSKPTQRSFAKIPTKINRYFSKVLFPTIISSV